MGSAYQDPYKAAGMCLIASTAYAAVNGWGLVRVTGMTYPGREHWACLRHDSFTLPIPRVHDATMRQFSATAPAPWQGTLDDWLDDMSELLNDHLRYECFTAPGDRHPMFTDEWVREDIEPGPMPPRPW